jgi:hypothetical protein
MLSWPLRAFTSAGRKRVARLMRTAQLQGVSRRQARTTIRDEAARPDPDLVDRQFTTAGPDRLWVADITYIPTGAGFLDLAVVLDAWSRRVIGWAMETHLRTELVLAALDMALAQRRPSAVIHHSDHGCQYTSLAFGHRCREAGVQPMVDSPDTANRRDQRLQDPETLRPELRLEARHVGHVAPRMCHGLDNPRRHRVSHSHEDNRYCRRRRNGGPRCGFANREDQADTLDAQRTRGCGQRVDLSAGESDREDHIAALLQRGRLESGPESL